MAHNEPLDLSSLAHKTEAYAVYASLRAETPVQRVALMGGQKGWLLTRYEDVSKLLKDDRFAKDPANAMTPDMLARQPRIPGFLTPLTRNMLGMDDPDHARLKRLVQAGFTPKRMDLLATRTEEIAEKLLSRLKGQSTFDLISGFALPLPVTVISEMLGVPEADQAKFARWSHILLSAPGSSWRLFFSLPGMIFFVRYLRKLIAMKRDKPADDLVSALVAMEADGERLNGEELQAMIAILLSAGHETTTNLIGNGTLALLQNRTCFEKLKADPALAAPAVEELLRYDGPVEASTPRYARADLDIAGIPIARGDVVLGSIASANRDDRVFANPDSIQFERTPNRHLTFGEGGHYCVGAALARMEGRVAFNALLRHFPTLRIHNGNDALQWRPNPFLRGLTRFTVSAGPQ
jgi:cytochrome P450